MKSIVLHAWTLHKIGDEYFIPYTHWVYLKEIVKYFDRVCLLSPINKSVYSRKNSFEPIGGFENVEVCELPYSNGYIDAIKNFFKYTQAYKKLASDFEGIYARYPIPFGWLQKIYFRDKKKIIHFVGDPVDTIKNNPKLSYIKKQLYINFFMPEHYMFMQACRTAQVFTNGYHLTERLKKYNIKSTPLISSTLNDNDFYFEDKTINMDAPKIIYVGYLRKAKGVETVLKSFALLQKRKPKSKLTIVGHGESEEELKNIVEQSQIKNVQFTGHIDNRDTLNSLLRNHDIFCFASLSEGSPRVILEAMANGLAIISTPVGSLPSTFEKDKEILFADFNDELQFCDQLLILTSNASYYNEIRANSYKKVSNFKIEGFLKQIFYEA